MKMRVKQSISLLLTVLMICSIFSLSVFSTGAITTNEVTSKLNSLIGQYNGKTATSSQMYMGSQCKGFANWVFLQIFGVYIGPYPESANYKISNANAELVGMLEPGNLNESSARKLLKKGAPGDYIQVQRSTARGKGPHSMILVGVNDNGIEVFDCNSDGKNTIKNYTISWADFDNANRAMSLYHAYDYNYSVSPPTNVYLDKNQYWYDIQDTITLYPHAEGATYYWLSVYKGDAHIVDQAIYGEYSFSASQWGYGDYYAWITAGNSAGGTDSEGISFTVCGAPSYSDIWTSKGFYDWDENEQITINVSTVCAKGQCIGIDFLDNNLNYVKRIITENCDSTFTVSAKTLGIGYFSAYFTVYNGSGGIDTKNVYFYVGQKKDVGTEFCAKIKNTPTNKYLTAVENNVEGKDENCDKQQVWFFYRLSDGSYKIKNYYDWRALDVHNYADAGPGTNVQVYEDWDSTAQRFYIYELCGSYYIKPVCTDMVLDMSQTTDNLEVWGAGFDWSPQKFDIEKIERSDIGIHKYNEKLIIDKDEHTIYKKYTCSICGYTYDSEKRLSGDVNGDGELTIQDATNIQLYLAELLNKNEIDITVCDLNGDGEVNVADATQIQMILAEVI